MPFKFAETWTWSLLIVGDLWELKLSDICWIPQTVEFCRKWSGTYTGTVLACLLLITVVNMSRFIPRRSVICSSFSLDKEELWWIGESLREKGEPVTLYPFFSATSVPLAYFQFCPFRSAKSMWPSAPVPDRKKGSSSYKFLSHWSNLLSLFLVISLFLHLFLPSVRFFFCR